jgi:uncharacterized membrane protein
MLPYQLAFDRPWYLLLLLVLPVLWWFSYRSLAGLGGVRRLASILLRSAVLTTVVCALAEMQLVRKSDRLTVFYLLDQSLSIAPDQDEAMIRYIKAAIRNQRSQHVDDRAGVVVFGREPAIEIPPLEEEPEMPKIESLVDREYTNIAAAMKLAEASFPHDSAKRIVLISDGNENIGDALAQARGLAEAGVSIDVLPVRATSRVEVAVEKLTIPPDVRKGQPFDLRVVLNNTTPPGEANAEVSGRLQVVRKTGERERLLAEESVKLPPGKRVFTIREEIDAPDFYTYEARFVPDRPGDDTMPQNNQASTFTHVRGSGQVLLIEDFENRGEYDLLVARLRAMNLEVVVQSSSAENLFADLGGLQPFDTVLLADVPREHFSDNQIEMLVRNTQNLGSGLVMLGGPNSFGAGGWTNTPIEAAMPVDFQIKNAKVVPIGALALLMHASEIADGNHWQKVVAREAIKTLGNHDYCGVLHWNGTDAWLWGRPAGMMKVGANRNQMLARLDRMTPGDMPQFDPAMVLARDAFKKLQDAAVKHMIIISDGDPSAPTGGVINSLKNMKVKVSTVAIGAHGPAESSLLKKIANQTGGTYYAVNNPKMLPRIYQKEARRVSRPLVFENKAGFRPQIQFPHEMIQGIGDVLPPITGYVMTTVKEGPLPEVSLVSPLPEGTGNSTILASWTYGLGKAVAFTTDAGKRWASDWTSWDNYDKLFSQIVRWSMRPTGDTGKFTVATEVEDGRVKLVVTALDKDDEFLNFLELEGTVVGPDMKPIDVDVKQTAPGRYVGDFEAKSKGNYFVLLNPGPGRTPIRVGVNVPYSDEFRDRQTNEGLLKSLAALEPKQGSPGKVIEDANPNDTPTQQMAKLLEFNTFRHDLAEATSSQDVWHLLLLIGTCLFFGDVFVRRVAVNFDWLWPIVYQVRDRLARREKQAVPDVVMDRLRSRKAEVGDELEQRRAATRFEPTPDAPDSTEALSEPLPGPAAAEPQPKPKADLAPEKEAESYTSRLLKAKQKVWDERKDDKQGKPKDDPKQGPQ